MSIKLSKQLAGAYTFQDSRGRLWEIHSQENPSPGYEWLGEAWDDAEGHSVSQYTRTLKEMRKFLEAVNARP